MNKIIRLIVFIFMHSFLFAQDKYATTSRGETIILKSDGTWIYATKKKSTANPRIQGIKSNPSTNNGSTTNKPTHSVKKHSSTKSKSSRAYYSGPRGGCYYINSNGNKTYVDRSLCN